MRTQLFTAALMLIGSALPTWGATAAVDNPTFNRDAAPIFFDHCVQCHRPGEVAPMSLLSYSEARPWARSIARAVKAGDMPPWSGNSDRHTWSNDISLTQAEIDTLVAWVGAGAPEGDPADLPKAPEFAAGWKLGEPDHVVQLDRIEVPADGDDLFPQQVIDVELDEDRWIRAIEFLPEDGRVTHHFLSTYTVIEGSDRSAGVLGIWTAGMPPYEFPDGMGRKLGKKVRIIVDQHYHPIGEATADASRIGLHFGEGPLKKEVATIPVTNTGLRIPPGAGHHAENAHYLFGQDVKILAFSPHMHVRGKAMKYVVTYPDGKPETLLDVPKYDYNWQWLYYPSAAIDIPAGSRLDVTAVWDNSANNPANPDPTREIIYRGDTFSEMFNGFIEVIAEDGVDFDQPNPKDQLLDLLARYPKADSYLVDGFIKLGFYVPREGEGWLYMGGIYSISLDDFEWEGNRLRINTQFPTLNASATTSVIEGVLNEEGILEGSLIIGSDTETPRKLPIRGAPLGPTATTVSGGGQ